MKEALDELARVPRIADTVRLRKREPFAYNSQNFCVFEFNEAGIAILRLVDGKRSVLEIARTLMGGVSDREVEEVAGKCYSLLQECAAHGAVQGLEGA
ncbi:MAG: PqqD family peptide modification chaperone [Deltaproteobacteria bacterium]